MGCLLWFHSYLEEVCVLIHLSPYPQGNMHIFGHDGFPSPVDTFKDTVLK